MSKISIIDCDYLNLFDIHNKLRHLSISRLSHFVRSKNLPFLIEDAKTASLNCWVCAEWKPRFYRILPETLVKATKPWERTGIDFKGPMEGKNKYFLIVFYEFSRYPFAFNGNDLQLPLSSSVSARYSVSWAIPIMSIKIEAHHSYCRSLKIIFWIAALPVVESSPNHSTGNSLCERINQTVWRTFKLLLQAYKQPESCWETVLPETLFSIRLLLCTDPNTTPREQFLGLN